MVIGEENLKTPNVQEPNSNHRNEAPIISRTGSSHPAVNSEADEPSPSAKKPPSQKEAILSVAQRIASPSLPCSDLDVWGVLTAVSNNARKRIQSAQEEAQAKVSALELEINAAMRVLDFERRRLKAARERIMLQKSSGADRVVVSEVFHDTIQSLPLGKPILQLSDWGSLKSKFPSRETQLQVLYSTTEEMSVLFAKQQEQLKAMQRTLEDEENYANAYLDADPNIPAVHRDGTVAREMKAAGYQTTHAMRAGSATSAQRWPVSLKSMSAKSKAEMIINIPRKLSSQMKTVSLRAAGLVLIWVGVDTAPILEGDAGGTEWVPETESPGADEDANVQDTEQVQMRSEHSQQHHQSNSQSRVMKAMDDTEPGSTVRTAHLLASEVAGSWAWSRVGDEGAHAALHDSNATVAEIQSSPSGAPTSGPHQGDCWALSNMVGIMAPDLKKQFGGAFGDESQDQETKVLNSDSDKEDCSNDNDDNVVGTDGESTSDAETQDNGPIDEDKDSKEAMDEDDDDNQEDSV
ncbi:hypothetical protein Ancab_037749 [Ancistrocladus abbreviatus]